MIPAPVELWSGKAGQESVEMHIYGPARDVCTPSDLTVLRVLVILGGSTFRHRELPLVCQGLPLSTQGEAL